MTEYDDESKRFYVSPPHATEEEINRRGNPRHPLNVTEAEEYVEKIAEWLETAPFSREDVEIPEDSVLQIVYENLEKYVMPNQKNYMTVFYRDFTASVYVLCNHEIVCRLVFIGFEIL